MNVAVTRAGEGLPRRAFTVAEIRRMVEAGIIAEDERFELIEGDLVARAPHRNQHEIVKSVLACLLARRSPGNFRLAVATSLYLNENVILEPDLCLYPKLIMPEDVRGEDLLLVIEVADSSLGYDRGVKARIYAKHGVPELWVIDAVARVAWVHRQPDPDGNWGSITKFAPDAPLTTPALPGVEIRLDALD
jgi:Uma2 family endonuclease